MTTKKNHAGDSKAPIAALVASLGTVLGVTSVTIQAADTPPGEQNAQAASQKDERAPVRAKSEKIPPLDAGTREPKAATAGGNVKSGWDKQAPVRAKMMKYYGGTGTQQPEASPAVTATAEHVKVGPVSAKMTTIKQTGGGTRQPKVAPAVSATAEHVKMSTSDEKANPVAPPAPTTQGK